MYLRTDFRMFGCVLLLLFGFGFCCVFLGVAGLGMGGYGWPELANHEQELHLESSE